ncbi:MAG TPA: carboxypeptidase regulatory-like domain-containing protein [Gemmatimonadales bacterium]|nr:carboxypeptidase regulatory-like domain-containing protein [Gemmatimonadales bacterium]
MATVFLVGARMSLQAQTVHGQVAERTSGLPVAQGFVVLLDTAGVEVARVLTDGQGRFSLKAPEPGGYRIQSKRIGFRAAVSPVLTLGSGEIREHRFEIEAVPVALPGLVVTGRARCGAVEGPAVAELWEEIREALAAVSWTSRQPYRYEKALYQRDLDLLARSVRRERTQERSGFFEMPFRSAPPQRLARDGYVVAEGNTRVFYGPDVDVVRSESFIRTHCFSAVAGTGRDTALVGLAFEPVRGRPVPDISGTLWVERHTAELRRLEYRYVSLPPDLRDAPLGGEVRFMALPAGGWIVHDWWIRTPLRAWVDTWTERELRVLGLQQAGGRVLRIMAAGQVLYAADLTSLSGAVFDETQGRALPGASVRLIGTPYHTTTDGAGRFTLTGTMEGEYQVAFSHPRLDSLAYAPDPVPVLLRPGEVAGLRLAIPAESLIVAQLCPDTTAPAGSHVLHGKVRDQANGFALPGVEMRASWQNIKGWTPGMPIAIEGRLRPFVLGERGSASVTDSLGGYLVCGIPSGRRVAVAAARHGRVVQTATLVLEDDGVWVGDAWTARRGRIWQHDLAIAQTSPGSGTIVAVATDATNGAPLANAVVSLVGADIRGVTDPTGRVVLEAVPPGTHTLVVRRIGHEALELVVTVPGTDTVRLPAGWLALEAVPFVLDTVVATGELEGRRMLELAGFYGRRRAGFGDHVTREEFEAYFPSEIADILRRLPAAGVRPNPNYGRSWRRGGADPRRWIVGSGDGCPALLFLDGVFIGDASKVDLESVLAVNQVEAVEAYNGPSQMPVEFNRTGSRCGVVVFWTRR